MSESAAKKSKLEEAPEAAITPAQAGKLLNANYLTNELVETIRDDYKSHKPFNYTVLPSFMDESFLKEVAKELESEEWFPKNNDLYTFLQTDDLKISEKVRYIFELEGRCSDHGDLGAGKSKTLCGTNSDRSAQIL